LRSIIRIRASRRTQITCCQLLNTLVASAAICYNSVHFDGLTTAVFERMITG